MKVNTSGNIPIKMWFDGVENGAMEQLLNLSRLPFAFSHIAAMPDCHQGYGMPIGGVLATTGAIVPNAVGVDIGCGMHAVKFDIDSVSTEQLKKIMECIRSLVPLGFEHHVDDQDWTFDPVGEVTQREFKNAKKQLGTLGGGNHFIEIQKGSDGYIWAMIHSGSRNLGKQVADYYNKKAIELNQKWFTSVPKEHELAFLPMDSDEGEAYIEEMEYCVMFAAANRHAIMDCITSAFYKMGANPVEEYDVAHNYARLEHHFGHDVWVHRKGATSARVGQVGIIPGSQGTSSFIVEGLGNPQSFMSCSHGAGRKMGRKEAQRSLNLADEQRILDEQGILHSVRGINDLDEASGAYKNIVEVIEQQQDLIEVKVQLKPLVVIKG